MPRTILQLISHHCSLKVNTNFFKIHQYLKKSREKPKFHEKTTVRTQRDLLGTAFWALCVSVAPLGALLLLLFVLRFFMFVLLLLLLLLLLMILLVLFSCVAAVWCSSLFVQLASACAAPVVCADFAVVCAFCCFLLLCLFVSVDVAAFSVDVAAFAAFCCFCGCSLGCRPLNPTLAAFVSKMQERLNK